MVLPWSSWGAELLLPPCGAGRERAECRFCAHGNSLELDSPFEEGINHLQASDFAPELSACSSCWLQLEL